MCFVLVLLPSSLCRLHTYALHCRNPPNALIAAGSGILGALWPGGSQNLSSQASDEVVFRSLPPCISDALPHACSASDHTRQLRRCWVLHQSLTPPTTMGLDNLMFGWLEPQYPKTNLDHVATRMPQVMSLGAYHKQLLAMRASSGLEGIEVGPILGRGSYGRVYKGEDCC